MACLSRSYPLQALKRKRRGGGGAQRAFFSKELKSRGLRLNMPGVCSALHAEYRALNATQKAEFRRQGLEASRRWRRGERSSFGTMSRRRERARREHAVRLAVCQRLQTTSPEETALALAGLAIRECGKGPTEGQAFNKALRLARSQLRLHGKASRDAERDDLRRLQAWKAKEGSDLVTSLFSAMGENVDEELKDFFVAEPGRWTSRLHLVVKGSALSDVAAFIAKDAKSNLKPTLKELWHSKHMAIMEAACLPLAGKESRAEPSLCSTAGVCICSPGGKMLKSLVDQFYKVLKLVFPHDGPERKALVKTGLVVCQFFSGEGQGIEQAKDFEVPQPDHREGEVWLHIGLMYLSPLRATFSGLEVEAHAGDAGNDGGVPEKIAGTPTSQYSTDYQALSRLCLRDSWSVRFWVLETGPLPIVTFVPGAITACCSGHEAVQFWPPSRRQRARRPQLGGAAIKPDTLLDNEAPESELGSDESWDPSEPENESEGGGDDNLAILDNILADELVEGVNLEEVLADGGGLAGAEGQAPAEPPSEVAQPPAPPPVASSSRAASANAEGIAEPTARRRGRATAAAVLPGGSVAYYESKRSFQAVCDNALHGSCVLTRGAGPRSQLGGRPCGLLSSWLSAGPLCETKEEHWSFIDTLLSDHAARVAGRDAFKETVDGNAVLGYERRRAAGESDEPV